MKSNPRFLIMLAALVLSSLACQAISNGVTSTTDQPSSNLLFKDDFSDTSSGWDQVTTDTGETDYVDGVYRIYVNETGTDVWANPGLDFTDVSVQVEAMKVGGPEDNDFGVICRSMDVSKFYFFVISSDGYYGIGKVSDSGQELIGMDAMQPSEAIQQGEATNTIRADCVGSSLSLFVNGQKLDEVQDSEFSSGDVGLIAGSFDTPGTDIHFDNFSVTKP
jgi:hypothetical protein